MYKKNVWNKYLNTKEIMKFGEDYKQFINNSKTERLCIDETVKMLEKHGFKNFVNVKTVKTGDKVYLVSHHKSLAAFIVGSLPIADGLRIIGSHVDSPRLDLKANPLYEDDSMALLDTHYYGGIKPYQWTTTPLALVGVVSKKDGSVIKISIGLDEKEPVFGVNELLVHSARSTLMNKPASEVVKYEDLDITVGSIPLKDEQESPIKKNILKILKEKYHIDEEDLISAEIEAVPSYKARDFGLDRSLIACYGNDDKSCAFAGIRAFLDINPSKIKYTSCLILTDKEETGSFGATGARSLFIENAVLDLIFAHGEKHPTLMTRRSFGHSKMISADVTAAADPLYKSAIAPHNNMAYINHGICFMKYTGRGGKSNANDADAEYIGYLRNLADTNNIYYQTSELGPVGVGGIGTIAFVLSKYCMDVVDAGVPVLNMHSTMEVISKADLYETYAFLKAFLLDNK